MLESESETEKSLEFMSNLLADLSSQAIGMNRWLEIHRIEVITELVIAMADEDEPKSKLVSLYLTFATPGPNNTYFSGERRDDAVG